MKKLWIFAAIAAIALTACQQEKDIQEGTSRGENNVSFVLQNGASTRSGGTVGLVERGEIIPVAKIGNYEIFLEETIQDLNACGAETRGTPVYTENLGYLFRDKLGVHTSTYSTRDVVYQQYNDTMIEDTEGKYWCYGYEYPTNIWGNGVTPVDFALYMPYDMTSNGVTPTFNGPKTTFTYVSPTTAKATKDIVFGGLSISFENYKKDFAKQGGTKVKLYHALTGVKFAVANPYKTKTNESDPNALELDIQIAKITFKGLADGGSCTFDPATGTFAWRATTTVDNLISQEYGATDLIDYDANKDKNHFAPSFFEGGANKNLNDSTASKTFWLVPQDISSSTAELTIDYSVNGKDESMTIVLGNLKDQNWLAGQLRTYTFKVNYVNVKIEDTVTLENTDDPDDPYTGSHKDDVVITNTGNTDAYIRAAIIGQWLNSEGNPVFGFTDFTASTPSQQYVLVDSWYQDQFSATGQHTHGAFKNLVGYKNDTEAGTPGTTVFTSDWWVKGGDGYYYFKYVVPAGKAVPAQDTATKYIAVTASGTTEKTVGAPLFESYTIKDAPDARVAGKVEKIYFELEIATQAISAKKLDGTYYTLEDAWAKAGITVTE